VVGFAVMLVLYSLFGGGAGDVKLMAAAGAVIGA
jgi:Flp pilus assembly protein protease CpaA